MADTRHKATQNETSNAVAICDQQTFEAASFTPLDSEGIAALRAFFDLLAEWDESFSKSAPQLRD